MRTPLAQDGRDLIVIFLGDEIIEFRVGLLQDSVEASWRPILGMHMKFVGRIRGFFRREGGEGGPIQPGRKDREQSALAAAEEEVPSALIDRPAILPRDPQAMLPCFFRAETKI